MRMRTYATVILLLVGALAGATIGYTQSAAAGRQQWEYVMVEWDQMREAGLVRLGGQGWELVTVIYESNTSANDTWYYFKRPK